jgi:hypothetical protein
VITITACLSICACQSFQSSPKTFELHSREDLEKIVIECGYSYPKVLRALHLKKRDFERLPNGLGMINTIDEFRHDGPHGAIILRVESEERIIEVTFIKKMQVNREVTIPMPPK